jgi:hypothetical protein
MSSTDDILLHRLTAQTDRYRAAATARDPRAGQPTANCLALESGASLTVSRMSTSRQLVADHARLGLPCSSSRCWQVEVQSPVGTLLQGLLEGLAGGEPKDEGGLGGELALDIGR